MIPVEEQPSMGIFFLVSEEMYWSVELLWNMLLSAQQVM